MRPVLVTISPAQRELVADLSAVASRYRAERLRTLALIGLAILRGGIGATHPPATASAVSPDPSLSPIRNGSDAYAYWIALLPMNSTLAYKR